jgi:hypothetical protein
MKIRTFWDVALYSLLGVVWRFRGAYWLIIRVMMMEAVYHPDDGDSMHLWNISLPQGDYMVLHPRRL